MDTVNEGSTAYLTCSFYSAADALVAPISINYTIVDEDSGAEVKEETEVAAASSVTITLSPTDNTLLSGKRQERRVVTVAASYGVDDAVREQYVYRVVRL